jgi:hypothetical protein
MGAPCFSCAVVPVSCRGGQSSFVGGWSERSSSLVDFRGLWVVSFVGGQGFALMVGGSCRSWAVVPVLCGGWSWFMGYWGGRPTSLVGQLWLFVGGRTHFVPWWAVVVGGCAPRRSWVLTGGKLSSFVGGWCESHAVSKPTKNPAKPGNPCHGYGLGWGYKYPTRTRTRHHPRCQPARVYKPVTFPKHLLALHRVLNLSTPFHAAVWALALCTFFGCRRLGELAVTTAAAFDGKYHVLRSVMYATFILSFLLFLHFAGSPFVHCGTVRPLQTSTFLGPRQRKNLVPW